MRVHIAVCITIWRSQVVSGWTQDRSCRLQPAARAGAAQSSPVPQMKLLAAGVRWDPEIPLSGHGVP